MIEIPSRTQLNPALNGPGANHVFTWVRDGFPASVRFLFTAGEHHVSRHQRFVHHTLKGRFYKVRQHRFEQFGRRLKRDMKQLTRSMMNTLDTDIRELQKRLSDGLIQRAYQGITSYMSRLRTVFAHLRGEQAISGLYQGYFDMTYFALFSNGLKERGLKLALVFNYETFGFEVWLAARNRKIQRHYWELLDSTGYRNHRLVEPSAGIDAIVTAVLATDYSIEDENSLTPKIVEGVAAFERDIILFFNGVDAKNNP